MFSLMNIQAKLKKQELIEQKKRDAKKKLRSDAATLFLPLSKIVPKVGNGVKRSGEGMGSEKNSKKYISQKFQNKKSKISKSINQKQNGHFNNNSLKVSTTIEKKNVSLQNGKTKIKKIGELSQKKKKIVVRQRGWKKQKNPINLEKYFSKHFNEKTETIALQIPERAQHKTWNILNMRCQNQYVIGESIIAPQILSHDDDYLNPNITLNNNEINKKKKKKKRKHEETICNEKTEVDLKVNSGKKISKRNKMLTNKDIEKEYSEDLNENVDIGNVEHAEITKKKTIKILNKTTKKQSENICEKASKSVISVKPKKRKRIYIRLLKTSEDTLLVALRPCTSFSLAGWFWLKPLVGSISVFGYNFEEGETRAVFSSVNFCSLPIDVLRSSKKFDQYKNVEIPKAWLNRVLKLEENPAIVEIKRYKSTLSSFLFEKQLLGKCLTSVVKEFSDFNLQEIREGAKSEKVFIKNPAWDDYIDKITSSDVRSDGLRIMIAGGQNTGKSTFLRYMANKLLKSEGVDEIAVLDMDPGQTEFFLPGTLSLVKFCDPLLGHAVAHTDVVKFTYTSNVFFGDVSPTRMSKEYFEVISRLVSESFELRSPAVPLILNTMGFTDKVGMNIIADTIRITRPTHVVTIESVDPLSNYESRLTPSVINSCGGIETSKEKQKHKVDFSSDFLRLAGVRTDKPRENRTFRSGKNMAKKNRNMKQLGYLSRLWEGVDRNFTGANCSEPIRIPFDRVFISVVGSTGVPTSHILLAINAAYVALCHVSEAKLERSGDGLPMSIKDPIKSNWMQTNTCYGWGVVQGIDPETKLIHILSPLEEEFVRENVNAIIVPKISLSHNFAQLFKRDQNTPYLARSDSSPTEDIIGIIESHEKL